MNQEKLQNIELYTRRNNFTGSGTESINLAIKGIAFKKCCKEKGTIITQKTEHPAVLNTLAWLKKIGFNTIQIGVNNEGIISLKELEETITNEQKKGNEVILVTIMYSNNEIGTIQPIKEIAQLCHKHHTILHTDACQATEYLDIDTKKLGVDLMTLNGSKVYAFKGTGLLYKKKGIELEPLLHGENKNSTKSRNRKRSRIVALAKAMELAHKEKLNQKNYKTKRLFY